VHTNFLPQCRWVIVDASRGDAPFGAANDRETIIRQMQTVPVADREHFWVLDRLAQDRAPFDQPHNRASTYGWAS
jgi:hypothetical protein